MTPETPDPPPVSPDPWDSVHEEFADMSQWETARVYRADAVDAARAADAALLRERDAQIASLTAQVEQQTQGYTLKGLSNYFGWGLESDRDVWQFAASREHTLRLAQELLETSRSDAGTAADAIRDRIDTLRAERDAAQQENQTLEILLGQASQASMLNRRAYFEEHDKLTALREALAQARQYVVARIDRAQDTGHIDRLHDLAAIDAALSSSPRPQEPQPAEPKSAKPVVNLMEALKKSLDSLNANRTSQEPGGHQP